MDGWKRWDGVQRAIYKDDDNGDDDGNNDNNDDDDDDKIRANTYRALTTCQAIF